MKNQPKAYLFAGLTILFWSTVATAFKLALKTQAGFQVLLIACLTSTVFLFFYLLASGQLPGIRQSGPKEITYSAILGLINPFLYYLILFKAYANLPAQVAQPLNMIWPIVLVLISIPILGQKITAKSIIGLIISFSGIILVSSQGGGADFHPSQLPYILLAMSTSIIWAVFWILNVRDKRNESVKLFLNFFFASIYLVVFSLVTKQGMPKEWSEYALDMYIGLFEMGLAYLFWLKALQFSETTDKISNFVFIFPFISLIFIHFILGEKIHFTTIYGLMLVVTGILLQRLKLKRTT